MERDRRLASKSCDFFYGFYIIKSISGKKRLKVKSVRAGKYARDGANEDDDPRSASGGYGHACVLLNTRWCASPPRPDSPVPHALVIPRS